MQYTKRLLYRAFGPKYMNYFFLVFLFSILFLECYHVTQREES